MLSKFIPLLLLTAFGCRQKVLFPVREKSVSTDFNNPYPTVNSIPLPAGYTRKKNVSNSFGEWLGVIKLKKDKTVMKYDGKRKENQRAQYAVLDISVGTRDLQQCADAVMRLRAEYLFERKDYDRIVFTDNAGTDYRFLPPYSREHFESYLLRVFGMCGSASLNRQLPGHIEVRDIIAGDVLIRGGFPGHAVIVMDVAVNNVGRKIYLLAQSYMPAQDIHILVNPVNNNISPWYEVNNETIIRTPEYVFSKYELKRW